MLTRARIRIGTVAAIVLGSGAIAVGAGIYDVAPAAAHHHHHHCIPQNNRGDHDSDNRGGPSDGDGCI